MILGIILVLGALSLFLYNRYDDRRAEQEAGQKLEQLEEIIDSREKEELPLYYSEMKTVDIDGYAYIGYLSIPVLGLELPVMSEWDYERLKISPCRYDGSVDTDNLVIAAHNYSRHFGRLGELTEGDEVYFTDVDGVVTVSGVADIIGLRAEEVQEIRLGGFDLTLFTCDYSGQTRVTVRCMRKEETE